MCMDFALPLFERKMEIINEPFEIQEENMRVDTDHYPNPV